MQFRISNLLRFALIAVTLLLVLLCVASFWLEFRIVLSQRTAWPFIPPRTGISAQPVILTTRRIQFAIADGTIGLHQSRRLAGLVDPALPPLKPGWDASFLLNPPHPAYEFPRRWCWSNASTEIGYVSPPDVELTICCPLYIVGIATSGLTWFACMQMRKSQARADAHTCRNCGYDLRATPARCPECGTVVS